MGQQFSEFMSPTYINSPFVGPIKDGNIGEVRELMKTEKVDYDIVHFAVHSGNTEIVKLLLGTTELTVDQVNDFYVCAGSVGTVEVVKNHISFSYSWSSDKHLLRAVKVDNIDKVKDCLKNGCDPCSRDGEIIRKACAKNIKILEVLLDDPRTIVPHDIFKVRKMLPDAVDMILSHSMFIVNNVVLYEAIPTCNVSVIKKLLTRPTVNPGRDKSKCVEICIENERLDVLFLLLADERVNPATSDIVSAAIQKQNLEIISLLFLDKRVREYLKDIGTKVEAKLSK